MSSINNQIKKHFFKSFNFGVIADALKKPPEGYFPHSGFHVFTGFQGCGKTIASVRLLRKLARDYPRAIIVSNIILHEMAPRDFSTSSELNNQVEALKLLTDTPDIKRGYIFFNDVEKLKLCLTNINNDIYGVIYVVDEMHTYFNSLESKNIPLEMFTEISQQRKQHKLILGCSQVFLRLAKPFREQCSSIIMCATFAGLFTIERVFRPDQLNVDDMGRLHGPVDHYGWFWHDRALRSSYDTFQKVFALSDTPTAEFQDMSPADYQFSKRFKKHK